MTPNKEDYLKCIYELGQLPQRMTNKQISKKMQFSAPAVSEMMKKLLSEGLVEKDPTLGYKLSPAALEMVSKLYRKHRLIEVFLVHHLHYSTEEIHEEAEILEHSVSTRFIDRLEEMLDYPETCPHGGSIPKATEILVEKHQQTLAHVGELGHFRLVRVQDDYQLLGYLHAHDLALGDSLEIRHIDSFAQTITVSFKQKELAIPLTLAQALYVAKD